ncbi:MAG: replication restart helicase PriA [Acidaminococcaceae bacterium]
MYKKDKLILTTEQAEALLKIKEAITLLKHDTFLLQGVTGSGKTEIYLRAAEEAVAKGKQVMVLVPEIALTGQIVERFKSWFGKRVAVVHSKLSQSERADVWYKMRTGRSDILIGVRSAVFAPFQNLGLIIMDEEQEYSYKQEERPSYHARTISLKRAQMASIPLLLGSATPDLCSYYHALNGRYKHLRLTKRPHASSLAEVSIIDMREELKGGNKSVISEKLQAALLETVERGEQAIVMLNRRGFSTFVMCRDCGESVMCPHCAVALVYHSAGKILRCHYCGFTLPIPDECPKCHSRKIKYFGTGTQKAEAAIEMISPKIKILRMDQDSTGRKFAHEEILRNFADGKSNVLLGTQMVAKGHDISNVTLVGILAADSQLNLPDFRAGERTFSLLTQAAGRAGRGDKKGHVVLQTYDADNEIIKLAAKQDYDTFAKQELLVREELSYPPFSQLLKITVVDNSQNKGNALAQRIVNYLQSLFLQGANKDVNVMGPFPGIVEKVRDLYRINILIKSNHMSSIKKALGESEFKEMKNVYFDVDPISVV